MFRNYLKTAFRNLWQNRSLTFINVFGLSVAMAITLLSLIYITGEFSFDRFHKNKGRIYRVILKMESNAEGTEVSSVATAGIGPSLAEEVPEVESMVRLSYPSGGYFTVGEKNFDARYVSYADSSFFDLFSFQLLYGNPKSVLTQPYSAVLTKKFAAKLFDDPEKAMGKVIRFNNKDNLLITGIVKDPPVNSHLQFDVLISFASLYKDPQMFLDWNGGMNYFTYVLLKKGSDPVQVDKKLNALAEKYINADLRPIGVSWSLFLQPLLKIHLHSNFNDIFTQGSMNHILILFTISMFILAIACFNFINLTTASSLRRAKEVGVRKVAGAASRSIIAQFITETMILSLIAFIFAIVLIEIFQLWAPNVVSDHLLLDRLDIYHASIFQITGVSLFILLFAGIIAGSYPAFYMARFQPSVVIKGKLGVSAAKNNVRNVLIVIQFVISVILIVCTLVIVSQRNFFLGQNPGFETKNTYAIQLGSETAMEKYEVLEAGFSSIPGVLGVGASSEIPGINLTRNGYFPEGLKEPMMIHALDVDYDYIPATGLKIVKGRNFSKEFGTDKTAYIINETLARKLNWDDPIGKTIARDGVHKVIGMVKDFHFATLQQRIEPLLITLQPWRGYDYLTVRISKDNQESIMKKIADKWKQIVPYEDFSYFSVDKYIKQGYDEERSIAMILTFCSVIALFIAGIGLFGLAAFITRQRQKEAAIRKIHGAGISDIFVLLSTGFVRWVIVANIIAWPVAWFIMDKWLQRFAYNAGIHFWIFIIAGLFTVVLSLGIILYQVIRLGKVNPVEIIRYE